LLTGHEQAFDYGYQKEQFAVASEVGKLLNFLPHLLSCDSVSVQGFIRNAKSSVQDQEDIVLYSRCSHRDSWLDRLKKL
jgi:hypothetical protein